MLEATVEVTRQDPGPALRLRPATRPDPRFWPYPALDWTALTTAADRSPPPEPPRPPMPRTVVTGVSGEARLAVRRFVSACLEVLNGYRPAAHLRRLAQPREASAVVSQGQAGALRVAEARRARTAGRAPRPRRPAPAAVVRAQLCQPREGAVEAAIIVMIGDRTWAMALRLEAHDGVWLATTLRVI